MKDPSLLKESGQSWVVLIREEGKKRLEQSIFLDRLQGAEQKAITRLIEYISHFAGVPYCHVPPHLTERNIMW